MTENPTGDAPATVALLGRQYVVSLPGFAEREEIVGTFAQHQEDEMRLRRVLAAAIGLCCGLGAASGASLAACRFDILDYGGKVYSYLREQGAGLEDVATAGLALVGPIASALFPREEEVAEVAGFTESEAAPEG